MMPSDELRARLVAAFRAARRTDAFGAITDEQLADTALDALASPPPDASNPLVEALRFYADEANWHEHDRDHYDIDGEVIGTERVPVAANPGVARAALAAHRPEREWRVYDIDEGAERWSLTFSTADGAWDELHGRWEQLANPRVQVREVGPWQDVTDGPEPHRVEAYQPVPREPGEHERLIQESVERAPHDTASRAFRPGEGGDGA